MHRGRPGRRPSRATATSWTTRKTVMRQSGWFSRAPAKSQGPRPARRSDALRWAHVGVGTHDDEHPSSCASIPMINHGDEPLLPSDYLGILARWMTFEPPPTMTATGGTHLTTTSSPKRASSRPLRWPTQKRCQCPPLMCGHLHGRPSKWTATIKRQTNAAPWRKEGDWWRRIIDAPAVSACGRRSNHGRSTPWIASSIFCKPSPSWRARQEPSSSCGGRSRTCRTSGEK